MGDIGKVFSGTGNEIFIAAEIGINHNARLDRAKALAETAKECGADAVKFQVFRTENFYNKALSPDGFKVFRSYELSFDEFSTLKEFCDSIGITFFATPLDMESLDFLTQIHVPVIKIASSDITCEPLLDKVKNTGIPAVLSTGFVRMEEIRRAVSLMDHSKTALLYCVSKYPASGEDFDLNFIPKLRKEFGLPVGYSDHSLDIYYSIAAAALGAQILERHFTLDNEWEGADHAISLNPRKFSEMVKAVRDIQPALGSGEKKITEFENKIRGLSMRGMYAKRPIRKGEVISENDIALLRPGSGVRLENYRALIGKIADKDIAENEEI